MFSGRLKKLFHALMSPDIMFFSCIWMMVLLVIGTVAQKYIGLYQAKQLFFSKWIVWFGPVPLPAGLTAIGLMTCALTLNLIFKNTWGRTQAGVNLAHIGGLLLLYGGLVTSLCSREGNMVIYEGDTAHYMSDYHQRELAVYDDTDAKIMALPFETLKEHDVLGVFGTPFKIEVLAVCENCKAVPDDGKSGVRHGLAEKATLAAVPSEQNDEVNKSGSVFKLEGADAGSNGVWLSVDALDQVPKIVADGRHYKIVLEKERTLLPFSLQLTKFTRDYYPGSDTASNYRSDVVLKDGERAVPATIQMNEPLRYRGYTFYQSSFIDLDGRQATVLAVVKNAGRIFPYIGSLTICVGLVLIVMTRLRSRTT